MQKAAIDISILEHLPVAIGIADFNGNIVFTNNTFIDLFRYNPNEIPTLENWGKLAYPDPDYKKLVFDEWNKNIQEAKENNKIPKPSIYRICCKNREYKLIEITFSIYDKKLIVFFKDVTEQKETEENFRTILEAFPDIIMVSNYKGKVLFTNKSLELQTGYTIEDFDKKDNSFIHPDDLEMVALKIKDLIESDKTHTEVIKNRFINKDGSLQWYSGVIAKTTYNNQPALLTISRNISKSKYAEQALIESETRMSTIFDSAPVIMLLINENREILQINKKGIHALNYHESDKEQVALGDVYKCINSFKNSKGCGYSKSCGSCTIRKTIEDTFNTGKEHVKVKATITTKEKTYSILLSSSLLKSKDSKEVLLTIDDITEREKIEVELKSSIKKAEESDRLKSAFLQNMSHEIRTPLNGILGFSGLLDNNELSDENRAYYISVINQSSNQLLTIVDDILSISRLETGQIELITEEVNVNNLLRKQFEKHQQKAIERNLNLLSYEDLNDKESTVFTDPSKLSQIIDNLLRNAIKFTNEGQISLGYLLKDDYLEFYVEDTGIGITPNFYEKIFERFQQVDSDATRVYGGTGLGLTIAKGNTDILGGKIWLESTIGKGSKFYFTIPYKPVFEKTIMNDTNSESIENKQSILVAEDEEINYLFIAEALKDIGHNLIHVYNGDEAVKQCKNNNSIVLVLMDIKMPKMDGYTALAEIKKIRPELPIIAQTAYAMVSDKDRALESGFNDYLSKPIKSKELIDKVTKYLTNNT